MKLDFARNTRRNIVSAAVNNFLNFAIGRLFRKNPDGRLAFAARSYVSTFIGQFFDNFVFAVLAFAVFAPRFWNGFPLNASRYSVCSRAWNRPPPGSRSRCG